jgi:poly-gamma-glutamate synthesis protein (capsule biosynthesis protein)
MLGHLAAAGFTTVGLANNHAGDLGPEGRARTKAALAQAGITGLDFADSPGFVRLGRRVVAIVAVNLVPGRDRAVDPVPSLEAERKLRLARTMADWVVVSVHWGAELRDWPQDQQRRQTAWFIAHGADLIIGAHPHVPIEPDCVDGRPVFYSLGNHVFDQKYPATKEGLIADCRIDDTGLSCAALRTRTPANSSFPRLLPEAAGAGALARCSVPARPGLVVEGERLRPWGPAGRLAIGPMVLEGRRPDGRPWRMAGRQVLSAEPARFAADGLPQILTIERHLSSIDGEDSPRPYVYAVSDHGLVARWRGSALAWPLIDARALVTAGGETLLCALHRGDSFLQLDPSTTATRIAVYRWNGFGFAAANEDEATRAACAALHAGWQQP